MNKKIVGFYLPGLGISGGIHIVLKWAYYLSDSYNVYIVIPSNEQNVQIPFLKMEESKNIKIINHNEGKGINFDILFATWWTTTFSIIELNAKKYGIFLQAWESQFYEKNEKIKRNFEKIIDSHLIIVTIANWLKNLVLNEFNYNDKIINCVLNGLDKKVWNKNISPKINKQKAKIRFLVEGPVNDPRKNIKKTLDLLNRLDVEYIWVGALLDDSLTNSNCIGKFTKIPYKEMPEIYKSCDVLVKASNAEGMFGPPVEMMSTGGITLAWDVEGSEEYLIHMYNAILVPLNDWETLAEWILWIIENPIQLSYLKENALRTVEKIPDWDFLGLEINTTIESILSTDKDFSNFKDKIKIIKDEYDKIYKIKFSQKLILKLKNILSKNKYILILSRMLYKKFNTVKLFLL